MTERGDFILVDTSEIGAEFSEVLKAVELGHRRVHIVRDGKTVAEIFPVTSQPLVASKNPKLQGTISPDYDPSSGLGEDEWPEDMR